MKDYQYLQQKYLVNTYPNRGLVLTRGKGVYLYDQNEEKYLDMMSNYGVNIFGYNHPYLLEKLSDQLKKLITLHCSFNNDTRAMSAEALVKRCAGGLTQVYFSNSGTEAIEAALKFAVLATGKKKFIACNNAYHGKTLGALSATSGEKYRAPFEPLFWNFKHIAYNNLLELEKAIDDQTAAFIVEPVQGEGGIILPDDNYLTNVRKICDRARILLILDEIQTGVGRTGYFLASEKEKISYDIVCLGKGLAGGIPIGASLVSQKVALKIPKLIHSSTLGGNPLACGGILAILELLDEKTLKKVGRLGDYFIQQLKTVKLPLVKEIRGKGLMIGVELDDKRNEILRQLQINKILAIPAGENVVRFLPPYTIEKENIDLVIKKLKEILNV
ncbi:aspartate aminotransferase family protein [Candidatus Shapirobacteria bacterium CG03_land_8_20_14_0_80_40_19]|uniref:Aspartate aminotransferase family protein n=4 Tax=Candidatus Shapironibacteriota TaxID=1752721 RepID=A0A2M7BDZ9_9BACT|nr:MAG: aspartate aminotransferase family protein [Candidatus Shapirobacteria bacterium CG11_big_fil_rev_8_21_14_0_20_40_12]PIV01310.1 MAG: aspartate aminotransferase family protein [Candidatus Shapirobacteria bacterium CG03_land_8_20_14_0_80_40_19]PJC29186.1 MAG: aspartate aminotransferase family protein [Candidatus Shapirobacteria bacterium CG_4_9_14_0_2_um_filter_40_11]PJC76645.1 MAG: aspartate aminotransferase family protein [Candidatus Shapirobacteria bacterium CG_4_8_14_3_um_filter_39_11]